MSKTIEELEEKLRALQDHRDAARVRHRQAVAREREACKDVKEAFGAWQRATVMVDNAFTEYWAAQRSSAGKNPAGDE
jgi:hypothetical protein